MSSYKKHHYVPKFLLKQFSRDGKLIDIFQLKNQRAFKNVGLKDQCYENFFYGKNPALEDAFSKIEGPAAEIIRNIATLELNKVTADHLFLLRQFIYYQAERTKAAANEVQNFANTQARPLLELLGKQHGFDRDVIDKIELKLTAPQNQALYAAASSMPAVMDLMIKVLVVNDSTEPLIISDNPVVKCNQFAEYHPVFADSPGTTGYALKGIQIFLPISPFVCVCLYDSSVYQYGSLKSPVGRMSKKDVQALNILQAVTADMCLYWDNKHSPSEQSIARTIKMATPARDKKMPVTEKMPVTKRPDGKFSQVIMTHYPSNKIGTKFSFVQIIDKGSYTGMKYLPPRSPELVDAIRNYSQQRRNKENI
jgi:hypothetical protein